MLSSPRVPPRSTQRMVAMRPSPALRTRRTVPLITICSQSAGVSWRNSHSRLFRVRSSLVSSRATTSSSERPTSQGTPRTSSRSWRGLKSSSVEELGCRSEEHTSELQSRPHLVCRLLLEKKKEDDTDGEEVRAVVDG